jgi:hypothetical protein
MDAVARKLLDAAQRMAPGRWEVRLASPQTHPHAPWREYERARQTLEHLGFRFLADVEVVSNATAGAVSRPAVLRLFVSHDGAAVAGFYRLPLRWTLRGLIGRMMGRGRGIVDVQTTFSDGTVVETLTARLVGRWASPPFMLREFQPQMHPATIVARHFQRVAEQAGSNPAARPLRVATLDEVVAVIDGVARRKRQFRQSIGWLTRDELAAGGTKGAQLDELDAAVRRLVAEQPAAAAPAEPPWTPHAEPSAAEWAAAARSHPGAAQPSREAPPPPEPRWTPHADASPGEWAAAARSHAGTARPSPGAAPPPPAAEPSPTPTAPSPVATPASQAGGSTVASSTGEPDAALAPSAAAAVGPAADGASAGALEVDPARVKPEPERRLADAGVEVDPGPPIAPRRLRPLEQVAGRALVMNALINVHFRAPVEVVRRWVEANGVTEHLSPRERALLAKPNAEVMPRERTELRGYVEGLWALLWAGGLADDLSPGRAVPAGMATLVPSLKANEDGSKLSRRMRLRPSPELLGMLDLYRGLQSGGDESGDEEPAAGASVDAAGERRKALEWLMDPRTDWDDVGSGG